MGAWLLSSEAAEETGVAEWEVGEGAQETGAGKSDHRALQAG